MPRLVLGFVDGLNGVPPETWSGTRLDLDEDFARRTFAAALTGEELKGSDLVGGGDGTGEGAGRPLPVVMASVEVPALRDDAHVARMARPCGLRLGRGDVASPRAAARILALLVPRLVGA